MFGLTSKCPTAVTFPNNYGEEQNSQRNYTHPYPPTYIDGSLGIIQQEKNRAGGPPHRASRAGEEATPGAAGECGAGGE